MRAFFAGLSGRERLILLAGAVAACGLLAYVALVEPFQKALAVYEREIPARAEELAWMRQAAREIVQRREVAGRPKGHLAAPSVLAAIDISAKELGLARALKRVEPEGRQQVKLWLEEAAFDDLLKWLARLEGEYAIQVSELLAESRNSSGYVNARITLLQKSEGR
jgi:general secretion pathway protein M